MIPKNKWVIGGIIAAIAGFGYLYIKSRNAAAAASAQPGVTVLPSTDVSTSGNEPGTGFNAGDSNSSFDPGQYPGYNGLGAVGTTPGNSGECFCPLEPFVIIAGQPAQQNTCNCGMPANSGAGGAPTQSATGVGTTVTPPSGGAGFNATPLQTTVTNAWANTPINIPAGTGPNGQGRALSVIGVR